MNGQLRTDFILLICPTGGVPLVGTSAPETITAIFESKENVSGMILQQLSMGAMDAVGMKNARTETTQGIRMVNSIAGMAMVDQQYQRRERQVHEKSQFETIP